MAGHARNHGEVHSYPVQDGESFDSGGYLLTVDADGRVGTAAAGATGIFGVNYKSTEDQDGIVQDLDEDDPLSTVRESAGYPLQGDAEDYSVGDDVYVSADNAGQVNTTSTEEERVGVVVESADHSANEDGDDNPVVVAFSLH